MRRRGAGMAELSCGVLVTDGVRLLLGHATRSPRWDLPKGLCEPGEAPEAAARRELGEETGLEAGALRDLGTHRYRPGKDLALFLWRVEALPGPEGLRCRSTFQARDGAVLPEMDRFGLFTPAEALERVGTSLRRVLGPVLAAAMPDAGPDGTA